MAQTEPDTTKEKVFKYLKIGLALALIIWLISMANGAKDLANKNADIIMVPDFKANYVAGGPQRFSSTYTDVENVDVEDKVKEKKYLWSTLIVKNEGGKEAQDNEIELFTSIPMKNVLIAPPGYSNDVNLSMNYENKKANISIDSIDKGEEAYVFVALNPPGYNKPYSQNNKINWTKKYNSYLQEINISSDLTETTIYGPGYSGYYD